MSTWSPITTPSLLCLHTQPFAYLVSLTYVPVVSIAIFIIIIATPDFLSLCLQSANHTVDNYTLWNGLPSYI